MPMVQRELQSQELATEWIRSLETEREVLRLSTGPENGRRWANPSSPAPLRKQQPPNAKQNEQEEQASWISRPRNPVRNGRDYRQLSFSTALPPALTKKHQKSTSKFDSYKEEQCRHLERRNHHSKTTQPGRRKSIRSFL